MSSNKLLINIPRSSKLAGINVLRSFSNVGNNPKILSMFLINAKNRSLNFSLIDTFSSNIDLFNSLIKDITSANATGVLKSSFIASVSLFSASSILEINFVESISLASISLIFSIEFIILL